MGNELYFFILPFDPVATPEAKIRLSIDLDDLVDQLQAKWSDGDVRQHRAERGEIIRLYVSTPYGEWNVAGFLEETSEFYVMGWPKRMAQELIQWYRHYIPLNYPLFIGTPETGDVVELTAMMSPDDLERLYPYPVSDD